MDTRENKKIILKSLAKYTKKFRGVKSQYMFCCENDISTSIISTVERGLKDPQLTTIFKLAEAFGMKTWEFVKLIEEDLPKDFCLIEK